VTPILNETHHIDQTIYNRLQWLAALMQDGESGSDARIKDYFLNAVHISSDNYDKLKASVIRQAESLKSRVESKDVLVDLDFEGTIRKLYASEITAAQAKTTDSTTSSSPDDVTSTPGA
jgi:hypothetical protein